MKINGTEGGGGRAFLEFYDDYGRGRMPMWTVPYVAKFFNYPAFYVYSVFMGSGAKICRGRYCLYSTVMVFIVRKYRSFRIISL